MKHARSRRASHPRAGLLKGAMVVLSCLSGCGESVLPSVGVETYPVAGKVVRGDGSPLPGGIVTFVSGDPKAPRASGPIAGDGTFSLNTDGISPGAPAGTFKVRIELDPEGDARALQSKRGRPFPAKYLKESTSLLTATVEPKSSNEFTFTLK
ncbi:hypothetical protein ACYOEI_05530 [Singulisphaera rosea]